MIRIENLSFTYSDSNIPALKDINLKMEEGEFIVITGRNGSGKSTLIKALLGIIPDNVIGKLQGHVFISEKPVKDTLSISSEVGVLLQNPDTQITNLTVWEEAVFGLENLCLPISQVYKQANSSLNQMGLNGILNQETHQLSGGQKQRLSLASLLAMNPKVLIMDEPLANLDDDGINSVIESLSSLRSRVGLIVISSHILEPFLGLMTRILVMNKGEISLDFSANQIADYHQELISNAVELPQQQYSIPLTNKSLGSDFISLSHVSYSYPNGIKPLLDINLTIHQGEKITLTGTNGTGKSTLARLLVGLRKPTSGKINNRSLHPKYVPQESCLSFMENSIENELLSQNIDRQTIEKILDQCNLGQDRFRSPFQLSNGQQKLLAIASAVATQHDLIVIDEPTAGLDAEHVRLILQMTSGRDSVFHITHDHRVISQSNRIITLQNGIVVSKR